MKRKQSLDEMLAELCELDPTFSAFIARTQRTKPKRPWSRWRQFVEDVRLHYQVIRLGRRLARARTVTK